MDDHFLQDGLIVIIIITWVFEFFELFVKFFGFFVSQYACE